MDNLTIGLAVTVVILIVALYLYKRSEDTEDVQQRKELEGAHSSIKQAQSDIEAIKKDKTLTVAEKERAIADAKKQLSDAQNLIQSKTADLDAVQKAKTAMELADAKSIADLKKSIEDRDKQIVTLKSDNARQTAEIDRRAAIHDSLVKSYNTKVNELNRVTDMASNYATDLQDARSKLTQSTNEIDALRTGLARVNSQCSTPDVQRLTNTFISIGIDRRVKDGSIKRNIIGAQVVDYTNNTAAVTTLDSTNIMLDGIILNKQVPSMNSDASQTALQLTTAERLIELGFVVMGDHEDTKAIGDIYELVPGKGEVLIRKFNQLIIGQPIRLVGPNVNAVTDPPAQDFNNPKRYFIRFNIYGSKPDYLVNSILVNPRFQ